MITPVMTEKNMRAYHLRPVPNFIAGRWQSGGAFGRLLAALVLALAALCAGAAWWLHQPLPLAASPIDVSVDAGATPREVAVQWVRAGVQVPSWALYQWFRLSGQSRQIKAGGYELAAGATPLDLLRMMVRGDARQAFVKLIDGWTFKRFRAEMLLADGLTPTTATMSDEAIMAQLGLPGVSAEGQFFPDTYAYAKGSTDLAVMRRALRAMQAQMNAAWALRQPDLPINTPQEALVLASIVEKETGRASDRPMVAAVFINRLRIGMPLQTDPSVIYGLGNAFDGNLRKVHLQTDTPYNTYTRKGLPPTPIAMPGKAALMATLKPADTRALYFVARGDGSSAFSATLSEHNRAVNQYQRNPRKSSP